MVINSDEFTSIELARQAAIAAAEEQDLQDNIDCLQYEFRPSFVVEHVYGQYFSRTADDYVWLWTGIEII